MSQLYLNSITDQHLEVLTQLQTIQDLTLIGGTALALQIGHRKSYDLDIVTIQKIALIQTKIQKLFSKKQLRQRLLNDSQYTLTIDQISVTFFNDEPRLHPNVKWGKINLANIKDIFSSKLFVLGKRATWRDYVDLAFLLKYSQLNLSQGIQDAVKRFGVSQKWILEPMTYFDDLTMTPIEWLDSEMKENEVKQVLISAVEEFLKSNS